jgi:hypothetical protein
MGSIYIFKWIHPGSSQLQHSAGHSFLRKMRLNRTTERQTAPSAKSNRRLRHEAGPRPHFDPHVMNSTASLMPCLRDLFLSEATSVCFVPNPSCQTLHGPWAKPAAAKWKSPDFKPWQETMFLLIFIDRRRKSGIAGVGTAPESTANSHTSYSIQ